MFICIQRIHYFPHEYIATPFFDIGMVEMVTHSKLLLDTFLATCSVRFSDFIDMSLMTNRVPTDKPRIQGYIKPELHRLFIEYQKELGCSQSLALEFLIQAYLGIDSQKKEILKIWADKEHRMVVQQAQTILEKAIDEWAVENLPSS